MRDAADGFFAKLGDGSEAYVLDIEITVDDSSYVLHPAHGYTSFMVEDVDGKFIGWMNPERIGFTSVKAWMVAKKYIRRCKCKACQRASLEGEF